MYHFSTDFTTWITSAINCCGWIKCLFFSVDFFLIVKTAECLTNVVLQQILVSLVHEHLRKREKFLEKYLWYKCLLCLQYVKPSDPSEVNKAYYLLSGWLRSTTDIHECYEFRASKIRLMHTGWPLLFSKYFFKISCPTQY